MTVIDWLLDSEPSIRWQVMRDLLDAPADEVAAERAKVATVGWGAQFLNAQRADGSWGGGANFPEWTGTKPTLAVLRLLGPDPTDPRVRRAIDLVRENVRWEYDDLPLFDGEVEPCINGSTVAIGDYFGQSTACSGSRWTMAAGTASRRTARPADRSTPRSTSSRASWSMSDPRAARPM